MMAAAAPAAASTTVGSPNLSSPSTGDLSCGSYPCVLVLDKVDGDDVGTPKGVITSWSVRNATGTIALRVLRSRPGEFVADELHATNISESADATGSGTDIEESTAAHQPVANGDYIGITLVGSASIGYTSGAGDQLFEVDGDLNQVEVDTDVPENYEALISANVEPDADNDGYGDETEDGCPSNGSTHGACPVAKTPFVPPFVRPFVAPATAATRKVSVGSRSATLKRGKAAITLKNANAVGVKGKLKLKLGKKVVGSGSYTLGAGATKTLKVKLAKAARKRIAKRGKVKLSLGLTAKGATGKTFKTTSKLTVKKAKKAKKKKRKKAKPKPPQVDPGSLLDGKYTGTFGGDHDVAFTVVNKGRTIVNLTGYFGHTCYVYDPNLGRHDRVFFAFYLRISSMAVAADGTFAGSQTVHNSTGRPTTTEIINGKLAGGRATGDAKLTEPECTATRAFQAVRTGP